MAEAQTHSELFLHTLCHQEMGEASSTSYFSRENNTLVFPTEGWWGKTICEGGLQPALHLQRHKHFPPTELTFNPPILSNSPLYLIASP